mmetsp:Transcript_21608/g.60058  ORF Transcript_21608/g.60058 Transcript_21608/m.60058 type:complete len:525 (-) Transcript_21608:69-1643(-)
MPSSSSNRRLRRRNYTSVANDDVDIDVDIDNDIDTDTDTGVPETDKPTGTKTDHENDKQNGNETENENETESEATEQDCDLSIIILDATQKKFPIPCRSDWTVETFKRKSARIHKVPPPQQRLIFRGRMLTNDEDTLRDYKLDTSDLIVHLFPKPRVVVTTSKRKQEAGSYGSNNPSGSNSHRRQRADNGNDYNDGDGDGDTGILDDSAAGAHVTTITIDQEEQDRRGQILVLGSVEIAESQNNIKMLSLLLVMICSMRLLALFSIAMGAAEEPSDPYHHHSTTYDHGGGSGGGGGSNWFHNDTGGIPQNQIYDNDFLDDTVVSGDEYTVRTWQTPDYFDLLVSAIGFYVGTLGMKATQENTSLLATAYAIGTIIAGIGWNVWNVYEYIRFFKEQTGYRNHDNDDDDSGNDNGGGGGKHAADFPDDDLPPLTRDDFVTVAFFTILMPLMVWVMCCVRAFEFRRLLREAEEEAAERIRNEYVVREGDGGDGDDDSDDDGDDDSDDSDDSGSRRSSGNARVTPEIV